MATFENIKEGIQGLYTPQSIESRPVQDNSIEDAAHSAETSERLGEQEQQQRMSTASSINNDLFSGADLAVRMKEQYNSNVRNDTVLLASAAHRKALNAIHASNDPNQINSISANLGSTLQGLKDGLRFIPDREKKSLGAVVDSYSDSIRQLATHKSAVIGVSNTYDSTIASAPAMLQSFYSDFSNAGTPTQRNGVISRFNHYVSSVENMPVLTERQQRQKQKLVNGLHEALSVATDPQFTRIPPQEPNQLTQQLALDQYDGKERAKDSVTLGMYSDKDPRVLAMSLGIGTANTGDIEEAASAINETQGMKNILRNSRDVPAVLGSLKSASNPVASQFVNSVNAMISGKEGGSLAQFLSPSLKKEVNRLNSLPAGSNQWEVQNAKVHSLERDTLMSHGIDQSVLNHIPSNFISAINQMDFKNDPTGASNTATALLNSIASKPFLYSSEQNPTADALRMINSSSHAVSNGLLTLSDPQRTALMAESLTPNFQRRVKMTSAFEDNSGKLGTYQSSSGKRKVSNMQDMISRVVQDKSDFPLDSLSVARGFDKANLARAASSEIVYHIDNGMPPSDAYSYVSNEYKSIAGSQSNSVINESVGGVNLTVGMESLQNLAPAGTSVEQQKEALSGYSKKLFNDYKSTVTTNLPASGKEASLVEKLGFKEAQGQFLGDDTDLRIVSHGSSIYVTNPSGSFKRIISPFAFRAYMNSHKSSNQQVLKERKANISSRTLENPSSFANPAFFNYGE